MHIGKFLSKFGLYCFAYPKRNRVPTLAADVMEAELVTSKIGDGTYHKPVLDIDFPCQLYESSSGGGHLLIDKSLTKEQYQKLLTVMTEIDLYNQGCLNAWNRNQMSCVRVPWLAKKSGEIDYINEEAN